MADSGPNRFPKNLLNVRQIKVVLTLSVALQLCTTRRDLNVKFTAGGVCRPICAHF
jgi:hypothetical protein